MSSFVRGLVFIALALVPSLADAECAWVLWVTNFTLGGGHVVASAEEPGDSFTTKDECDQAVGRLAREENGRRQKAPTMRMVFKCLPDTVDPRGPKGR